MFEIDEVIRRPTDLQIGRANPSKANEELNWKSKFGLNDIIEKIIEDELFLLINRRLLIL